MLKDGRAASCYLYKSNQVVERADLGVLFEQEEAMLES
jgi:hypothetical protein